MKILATFTFWYFLSFGTFGQSPAYQSLIKKADSLYKTRSYLLSAQMYSAAFKSFGWKGIVSDRYNAACSWALADSPDSAFFQLEKIAFKGNYINYKHITTDADLRSLHKDHRWVKVIQKVSENKEKSEIGFNKQLLFKLDSMYELDQKWRNYLTRFLNKQLTDDTISEKRISASLQRVDSLNHFELKTIFKTFGFPNTDLIGSAGTNRFWLLVQHQDLHPDFQEEVLVEMKKQTDAGKASRLDYAYLLDRVRVNTGRLQVFGTQMILNADKSSYEPKPVEALETLNERRASVGLSSIEDYIQTMNSRYFGSLEKKSN
jgi:hypothetical protein